MYQDENEHYQKPIIHQTDHLVTGVIVPGLQAVITAILSGLVAGALAAWLGWPFWGIGFTAAAVAALASWLQYRARWAFVLERVLGVDLNHDGFVGEPYAEPARVEPLRVIVEEDQGRHVEFIDLPYPEKLPQLAAGLLAGHTFAQESFNHILKRDKFNTVRDEMIRRGLARWKVPGAPTQGVELTPAGRAVMKRITESTTPTLPDGR